MARQLTLFKLPPNPNFELFWQKYPRKEAKIKGREAFERVVKSGVVYPDRLIAAAERFAKHVFGKDRQFIPLPASWLNAGRWDDEYESPNQDDYEWRAHKRAQTGMSKYQ